MRRLLAYFRKLAAPSQRAIHPAHYYAATLSESR
jgi:hypothetical protein